MGRPKLIKIEQNIVIAASIFFLSFTIASDSNAAKTREAIDFCQSFLSFEIDKDKLGYNNRSRRGLLSTLTIQRISTGEVKKFYLGSAVRAENMYMRKQGGGSHYIQPNYEVYAIYGEDSIMFGRVGYPYRLKDTYGKEAVNINKIDPHIVMQKFQELNQDGEQVLHASESNELIQAVVEYEENGYKITMEFPLQVMNTNRDTKQFQVAAGPIIIPRTLPEPKVALADMDYTFLKRAHINFINFSEFEVIMESEITYWGVKAYDYRETAKKQGHIYLLVPSRKQSQIQ